MRKIVNTFKYGSAQTKRVLVLCLLSGIATVGLAVSALALQQMLLFFGMVISAFITLSLAQTFQIHEGETSEETGATPENENRKKPGGKWTAQEEIKETAERSSEKSEADQNNQVKERANKKQKTKKKEKGKKKEKTKKKERIGTETEQAEIGQEEQETEPDENLTLNLNQEENAVIEPASEEVLKTYDKHKIKKTFRKYKVKRDHRMVLIDYCKKLNIYQTAAYIWVYDKEFHILLIEKEPRHITIPLYSLREISYLKKQPANADVDYAAFQGNNMMAELFKPYLPDYSHSTVVDDLSAYKNLYGVGPDIYFTNRSAASLFDLLGAEFRVDDKVTMSTKVNTFFKEAYKSNILLRDNVIDANGYADRISNTLDSMARSTISYAEFKDTLNLMIKNKLITQEFAMYYMGVRDKISR